MKNPEIVPRPIFQQICFNLINLWGSVKPEAWICWKQDNISIMSIYYMFFELGVDRTAPRIFKHIFGDHSIFPNLYFECHFYKGWFNTSECQISLHLVLQLFLVKKTFPDLFFSLLGRNLLCRLLFSYCFSFKTPLTKTINQLT